MCEAEPSVTSRNNSIKTDFVSVIDGLVPKRGTSAETPKSRTLPLQRRDDKLRKCVVVLRNWRRVGSEDFAAVLFNGVQVH